MDSQSLCLRQEGARIYPKGVIMMLLGCFTGSGLGSVLCFADGDVSFFRSRNTPLLQRFHFDTMGMANPERGWVIPASIRRARLGWKGRQEDLDDR
jgi:hypothetical protein